MAPLTLSTGKMVEFLTSHSPLTSKLCGLRETGAETTFRVCERPGPGGYLSLSLSLIVVVAVHLGAEATPSPT
jgi:hypothetical protein